MRPSTTPNWIFTLPGKGPVELDTLGDRVAFLHMPKTGGSTLRGAIETGQAQGRFAEPALVLGHAARLQQAFHQLPGLRVVCTIRDPIARFVSGFYSRLRSGRPKFQLPWDAGEAAAFHWFAEAEELALAFESPDERLKSAAWFAKSAIRHLRWDYPHYYLSADFVRRNAARFAFVGEIGDLSTNLPRMLAHLGQREASELPLHDTHRHAAPANARAGLSPQAEEILRRVLAADYEIYSALQELSRQHAG